MPEFVAIGCTFNVRPGALRGDYAGAVLASCDAFLLYIGARSPTGLVDSEGVQVGVSEFESFQELLRGRNEPFHVRSETLPLSPIAANAFPNLPAGNVVIIPRAAIERIHYGFWGSYDLVCSNRTYCIGLNFINRSRTLATLNDFGWNEKYDPAGSPSVVRQLAPLWGLVAGAAITGGVAVARGAPLAEGRGAAIESAAIGAMVGLAVGVAIYLYPRKC